MIPSRVEQSPFASLLYVVESNVSQTERLYRMTQMIESRGPISFNDLAAELMGRALMRRRRLKIDDCARQRSERAEREVSPQRLVRYRGNWYLDACLAARGR